MRDRTGPLRGESGFALIELLVVVLIIGLLAAIAIPSFLNQKGKASDASAEELAHTAQIAIESCATDNSGSYSSCNTPTILAGYEATLPLSSGANAWLEAVSVPGVGQSGNSYTVTTESTTGDLYSITRSSAGHITRTCTGSTGQSACAGGSW